MGESGDDRAADRRATIARAVVDHRKGASDDPVRFRAVAAHGARDHDGSRDDGGDRPATDRAGSPTVAFADRTLTLAVDDDQRARFDELLAAYPVFKLEQPATRKAPDGEVHVAAIADAKHTADFVDDLFLTVYERGADYLLAVERPPGE